MEVTAEATVTTAQRNTALKQAHAYPNAENSEAAALSNYEKAKALKTDWVNETDESNRNKIFYQIYDFEKQAELHRREAVRLRARNN